MDPQIPLKAMVLLRMLSAGVELTAAWMMWKIGRLETAVQINVALGLFGPTILVLATLAGVAGLAGKLPVAKLLLIGVGVLCILLGVRR